jgi:CBS domain-containing protein
MLATHKPLENVTAADVMSRDLVVVPVNMALPSAAHLLSQTHITGAPVVNDEGVCVGVISTTDFVRRVEEEPHDQPPEPEKGCVYSDWQAIELSQPLEDSVCNYMTPDPVMATPDARLGELAAMMVEAHIHRVVIVDEHRRPQGIVSSTDILAALARRTNASLGE